VPSVHAEGECDDAVGLDVGEPVPTELVSNGIVVCGAVALPVSTAADVLALESWADALDDRYKLDVLFLQGQIAVTAAERDWYADRLKETSHTKFWAQPWVQRMVGGASVLAVVGVAAWGLGEIE
jgi:hypothetical protein